MFPPLLNVLICRFAERRAETGGSAGRIQRERPVRLRQFVGRRQHRRSVQNPRFLGRRGGTTVAQSQTRLPKYQPTRMGPFYDVKNSTDRHTRKHKKSLSKKKSSKKILLTTRKTAGLMSFRV
jgi:hypothetical protein